MAMIRTSSPSSSNNFHYCHQVLLVTACLYLFICPSTVVGQSLNFQFRSTTTTRKKPGHQPYSNFAQQFLSAHNGVRRSHGEPTLLWSGLLERYARAHAQRLARTCAKPRSSGGRFGENFFKADHPREWPIARLVGRWAKGVQFFNLKTKTCSKMPIEQTKCAEYTRIVWWKTKRVGCGQARCRPGGAVFTVCAYDPAGRYRTQNPFAHRGFLN